MVCRPGVQRTSRYRLPGAGDCQTLFADGGRYKECDRKLLRHSAYIHALLGFTIKIDGLGTFRISFSSEGAETEDTKVTPDKMRSIRILFRPDADLRARILQEMEYERVTEGEVTVDPDDENDEEIEDGPVVQ